MKIALCLSALLALASCSSSADPKTGIITRKKTVPIQGVNFYMVDVAVGADTLKEVHIRKEQFDQVKVGDTLNLKD